MQLINFSKKYNNGLSYAVWIPRDRRENMAYQYFVQQKWFIGEWFVVEKITHSNYYLHLYKLQIFKKIYKFLFCRTESIEFPANRYKFSGFCEFNTIIQTAGVVTT